MRDTANSNCRELLDVLIAQGVRHFIASPGSRNAPVLIGLSVRKSIHVRMVNDERTAAFTALGIAISLQKPVALVCTSGTALYNYAPAIAEAYYQKIPLIVISADRPSQWIDQDDSQTLHQFEALDKIVKKSFDIPAETGSSIHCRNQEFESERAWFVNRIVNEAFLTATQGQKGPVHINIQFPEPLNETVFYQPVQPRTVRVIRNDSGIAPHKLKEISEYFGNKKIMVVAGFMLPDDTLNRALTEFSKLPNVTVLCETLSNIHLEGHAYMIDSLLVRMTKEIRVKLKPDVVITIGGSLVSRMLKEYLRECEGTEHWTLQDTAVSMDCMQRLRVHVDVPPSRFFKGISGMSRHLMRKRELTGVPEYGECWQKFREYVYHLDQGKKQNLPWSEYKALGLLFNHIKPSTNLFLSNGTCVRYAQLLLDRLPHGCYSNRGVSGIDGTNATASGMAMAYKSMTLLVTGDVSFSYCTEILNRGNEDGDLRIVVVNNSGGGIFRFIKTTRNLPQLEQYFCSDPRLHLQKLAEAYNWNYIIARNEEEMEKALDRLMSQERTILEIKVDPETSASTLIDVLTPKND